MGMGKKRLATLVGCNYAGTRNELRGCINDVEAMRDLLVSRFGFDPVDVVVLTDAPGSPIVPTGANIRQALGAMVDRAEPGDVILFHYSGHGTLVPAVSPRRGRSRRNRTAVRSHRGRPRRDEAIVPCDFNLITDVDFRQLVDRLPHGVNFTIISDSCHSGGLIDKEKEQIGPSTATNASDDLLRHRTIPFEAVLGHLASLSNIDSPHVNDHLFHLFGDKASPKFYNPIHSFGPPIEPDDGILLSGCQTNETSADMCPDEDEGILAYGAFSNSIQVVMKDQKVLISNRELVARTRQLLGERGFTQHPCLYCSDENADAPFLWQSMERRVTRRMKL